MMGYMQRLGKSLMLPVSVIPIAAILKGIGYWIDPIGWGENNAIAAFMIESGGVIIDNLPLLFALGIAMGMAREKDPMVVISCIVSYLLVIRILSVETVSLLFDIPIDKVSVAFENSANAFIGIIIGLLCSSLYNRFSRMQLPLAISFFGGKRFVPIICSITTLVLSVILLFAWPYLFDIFIRFGEFISGLGPFGAGLYGFYNRLLIPTGLHHALNSVVWFDMAGINDIGKFWGTVSGGVLGTTGMYQAGFFPIMMFGLPGAALAMYKCARIENKKHVGAILLSGAFASFLTGVTEPLEFSFMFVAPVLYVIHAILTGIFVFIAASMQWLAGFGFSAGLIDYILSIKAPFSQNIFMLIPLGGLCGFIYYCLFRFVIMRYNLMTPGRETDESVFEITEDEYHVDLGLQDYDELAIVYVEALGGRENIVSVESCITRLRIQLYDIAKINEEKIMATGVSGIVKIGKCNVQIIVGTEVDFIADSMNDILR